MESMTQQRSSRRLAWTMRRAPGLFLTLLLLPSLTACGLFQPRLRAVWCSTTPKPNGLVEKYPWANAPTLTLTAHRGRGEFAETRPVQIKACYDGRALSLLVRWYDDHEALIGRYWTWNEQLSDYQLQQFPIDQCAVLLPISKKSDGNPWSGKEGVFDAWHWRAGWSDLSSYADDRRLAVRRHPWGTSSSQVKGRLYPLDKRRGMVELEWIDDAGKPGTAATPKPMVRLQDRLTGAEMSEAKGSIADVPAQGVYTPRLRNVPNKQESWRYYTHGDDWFVEFYRLLTTGSKENDDCQLRGRGPFTIAIALWDNDSHDNFFITDPIRLTLDKPGK